MEAIKIYIDNVFKAFEQSGRVETLKRDMLASMEEKYLALKADGRSEHEAVGSVIADFGNIDEIAAEMGILTVGNGVLAVPSEAEDIVPLSREEAYEAINQFKKSSIWIGVGVWTIMTGIALFMFIGNQIFENANGFALLILLSFIAAAVPLFIVHGMALSKFEIYEEKGIHLDTSTRAELELARKDYTPKFAVYISFGVVIILLAIGIFTLLSSTHDHLQIPGVSILLFMIGGAVMLFINSGMTFGVYEMLLEEGDYARKYKDIVRNAQTGATDSERVIGTVASVYWPIIVAAYLLWSFLGDAWDTSWLIWPIAGVLFGGFAGGISTWNATKK
jgi:cation transport ATPase